MSLYHKYRPETLEAVKGNELIIGSLDKMLSDPDTCPHVFLLHGATGCGKTTIGRIIANRLECKGGDFREINSASFRGIDTVRDIIKNSHYLPMEGKTRVWLVDEVHKWTNDAQNAVLKILEDTPPHVYFILCTTEPNKLISAIKGRCIDLQVKTLSDVQMKGLLRNIIRGEDETLSTEIYDQIILDSQGHPRNAINILEQVLKADPDQRLETAQNTVIVQTQAIELCRVLMSSNAQWKEVRTILSGLKDQEPEDIRRMVMGYASAVLLKSDNVKAGLILENFVEPFYNSGFPGLVFSCYSIIKI